MQFDLQWLLLLFPLAFALGWMASRLDLRQLRREQRESPRAYFKGLSLLLNEQQDKAIDAFIEAVQHDADTAELHFALGNLFRRRGEYERAVRVHEHLLARADLSAHARDRAQQALAQDFMRAGLFDRAEAAWNQLLGTAFDADARMALLSLHERARDWPRATAVAQALEQRGAGSFSQRIAHYQCELALQAESAGDLSEAEQAMTRARNLAPRGARAWLQSGQMAARQGRHADALRDFDELRRVQPLAFNLIAAEYVRSAQATDQVERARAALGEAYAQAPSTAVLQAWRNLPGEDAQQARERLLQHTRRSPSLSAALAMLAEPIASWGEDGLTALRAAVDQAAKPRQRYRCAACGFEARHWFWQCPGCLGWDTFPAQTLEDL
jgi:lipopolysaccharide biosynthesis regulator YciM